MEPTVVINGTPVSRDAIRKWLKNKHCTLWMDWIITDSRGMESAVDFIMDTNLSLASVGAL